MSSLSALSNKLLLYARTILSFNDGFFALNHCANIPLVRAHREEDSIERYEELRAKSRSKFEKLSPKEEEIIKTLTVAIEMVQRGYKFDNLDLYKSDATKFIVNHENKSLIPPFIVVDGLGENAANSVIEARKDGEFISKEDLLRRTKLNGTNIKDLSALGVLDSLNETDQLSLFDFDF